MSKNLGYLPLLLWNLGILGANVAVVFPMISLTVQMYKVVSLDYEYV